MSDVASQDLPHLFRASTALSNTKNAATNQIHPDRPGKMKSDPALRSEPWCALAKKAFTNILLDITDASTYVYVIVNIIKYD